MTVPKPVLIESGSAAFATIGPVKVTLVAAVGTLIPPPFVVIPQSVVTDSP